MKSVVLISIFVLLLSACAPAPLATTAPIIASPTIEATAPPSPEPSPDEGNSVYLQSLGPRLTPYLSAYGNFSELHRQASADPSLLLDSTWANQMETALEKLDNAATSLESISPVPPVAVRTNNAFKMLGEETHLLVAAYRSVFSGDTSGMKDINDRIVLLNTLNLAAQAEMAGLLP